MLSRDHAVTHATFGTHLIDIPLDTSSIMEILCDHGFRIVNMATVERHSDIYNIHYILVDDRGAQSPVAIPIAQVSGDVHSSKAK